MGKTKIEDAASVPPWRQPPKKASSKYDKLGMRATSEPGRTPMMYAPSRGPGLGEDASSGGLMDEIDPELRLAFSRNFQFLKRTFSIETLLRPLPPQVAQNVAVNLGFFTRIFTQFFDTRGIHQVQSSMGLGEERSTRRVS